MLRSFPLSSKSYLWQDIQDSNSVSKGIIQLVRDEIILSEKMLLLDDINFSIMDAITRIK